MARDKNKPNLIIKIEDSSTTRADFIDCLARYSAQLYEMKKLTLRKDLK